MSINPDELKGLHQEEKQDTIEYSELKESSLKNIDEMHKLFPELSRENIHNKLNLTLKGLNQRFVVRKNGKIIGQLKVKNKKGIHSHLAEFSTLKIDRKERRHGFGIGLMDYALSKMPKKIKVVTLEIDTKNKETIKLCRKAGFEKYGILEKGSKIDGKFINNYLMKKEINQ
jgi:ribosomal protein S18 acetylase RimI-like enzyme